MCVHECVNVCICLYVCVDMGVVCVDVYIQVCVLILFFQLKIKFSNMILDNIMAIHLAAFGQVMLARSRSTIKIVNTQHC